MSMFQDGSPCATATDGTARMARISHKFRI
jgi:hypothetical protein